MLKIVGGFALLLAGGVLALPGIPGPGIPLVLIGLTLLSSRFAWAKRALDWIRRKFRWLPTSR